MILKIADIERLLPQRDHIELVSVTIDGEQVPIEDIEFKEDEIETKE